MSYDLMVFEAEGAPRDRPSFMTWYWQQTEWSEPHSYDNPEMSAPSLQTWFREMIESFPPMNGPLATDDVDNPKVTDYSVGRQVIYAAFAWSMAEEAQGVAKNRPSHLARLYGSADNAAVTRVLRPWLGDPDRFGRFLATPGGAWSHASTCYQARRRLLRCQRRRRRDLVPWRCRRIRTSEAVVEVLVAVPKSIAKLSWLSPFKAGSSPGSSAIAGVGRTADSVAP